MEEIKNQIIELFESRNVNIRKGLKREFEKLEQTEVTERNYKYRNILIFQICEDLNKKDETIFNNVDNPFDFVETTLFNHLC